jgi:DNA modification methylase
MVITSDSSPQQFDTAPNSTNSTITSIRFHPKYARIIPKLKYEEYQELKSSIVENGLYHPVIINKDGFVLDGHHRFKACRELGIEPKFEVRSFDDPHMERVFVIDTNLARRQLEPYSRVELVLLKKEQYLELGKQRMSEAGEKGNDIKWHYHHLPPCEQYCDLSIAEVKQESGAPSSSSCIGASPAQLQQQRVEGGFGFVEIDKPDNGSGSDASSISSSSFNTQKELAQESQVLPTTLYEAEYITKNGSEEQKEKLRHGETKIHKVYTLLKQKEKLEELHTKIESGLSLTDKDILNNLGILVRSSDVWIFRESDELFGLKYPGKTHAHIVFNILYFFTERGDLVIDPMAGGGVVGDVCKVLGRKCYMYDVNSAREDIVKHDLVKQGFPKEMENADLIFWDPPYYKKKMKDYGPQSISSLSREEYLQVFERAADAFARKGVKKVALLISNYDDEYHGHPEENIFIHHYINQFEKTREWHVCRIIDCPLPAYQISGPMRAYHLESKTMARLCRSLVIFVRTAIDDNGSND